MSKFKIAFAFVILASVLNCSRISEKIEEKVNKKIDEKVDEQLNKIDSNFKKMNIDSLKMMMDSLSEKTKNIDKDNDKDRAKHK